MCVCFVLHFGHGYRWIGGVSDGSRLLQEERKPCLTFFSGSLLSCEIEYLSFGRVLDSF